jgi:LysR family transcriptional regulator, nitrogen assimilation regulatory protein
MNLSEIRTFALVVETGSIRRAAELLHLSPAAVSRAVSRLEADLGYALFIPSGRGIAITDAGRALSRRASRLLGEYESFVVDARSGGAAPVTVRIGSFEIFTTHFLGWALERFFRNRSVLVRELVPGEIEEAVRASEVDYGITYLPSPDAAIDLVKVASQTHCVFGRQDVFGDTPFADLPFCVPISSNSPSVMRTRDLDGWPVGGSPRRIRFHFEMLETALATCARGLAVLFAPPFLIRLYNERAAPEHRLSPLALPGQMADVRMDIYLVKRTSTPEGRDLRLLARALREACREPRTSRSAKRERLLETP